MTKQDLAKELAKRVGINTFQATTDIEALMGIMQEAFIGGKSIFLRGFGTFKITTRKEKLARNISAGTSVVVPEHMTVTFKPAPVLKEAMN